MAGSEESSRQRGGRGAVGSALLGLLATALSCGRAAAQAPTTVDLTLDSMVELMLENSYQVQFLEMSVQQTRHRLRAENARLRSRVDLELTLPTFQEQTEFEFDDDQGISVPVRQNSRRWEGELSISQPVIIPFLGYPTNGYLSLRNQMYRDTQLNEDGDRFTNHYNQYFIQYTQPLFQPNELKNDLEEAQLDFESEEITYGEDMLEIVDQAHEQFFELFENAYEQRVDAEYVAFLRRAATIAEGLVATTPARSIELNQIRIELANAEEDLESGQSQFRLETASLKTSLNIPQSTVITLDPVIQVQPVQVDVATALQYAREMAPDFRELAIDRRRDELEFEDTQGEGGFQMELEFTYGREKRDPEFDYLWNDPDNTYSVDVTASLPIWDWGERNERIAAARIDLQRADLEFQAQEREVLSEVENEIRNIQERQGRVLSMQSNLTLARDNANQSLDLYEEGTLGAGDLLQNLQRYTDTAENFLEAYLEWRESLESLQEITYYDFERNQAIMERWGIAVTSFQ